LIKAGVDENLWKSVEIFPHFVESGNLGGELFFMIGRLVNVIGQFPSLNRCWYFVWQYNCNNKPQ